MNFLDILAKEISTRNITRESRDHFSPIPGQFIRSLLYDWRAKKMSHFLYHFIIK